jgi:membrane-bound serine protease (ClpP class)
MTRRLLRGLLLAASVVLFVTTAHASAATRPRVLAIRFGPDLDISPATQSWVNGRLDHAVSAGYDAAVIELDTPGGLSTSMKSIYQHELALKIPVIVYVSPDGARAASAGVWLSQAADVLAMSPISNIGSSTPIDSSGGNLGSDLRRKVINDAAASLRALAQAHHRNTTWPVLAVTEASNLTAQQALRMHVIDLVAPSLPALLQKLDGYRTTDAGRPFTLHLAGARIDTVRPGFVTRLLDTIIDPNLISILFLAGIAGLVFEVLHPGIVLPGALGACCLVAALYGFSVLNPSWGGVALIVLGIALLVVDLHAMTHGALTTGGLISLGFGLALLFQNQPAPYHVNTWLVVGIGSAVGAFYAFVLGKAWQARRMPVGVTPDRIVGLTGEARERGLVFVDGELWQAHSDEPLAPGESVVVVGRDGLVLEVRPVGERAPVA